MDELIKVDDIKAIVSSAPLAMSQNKLSVENAEKAGNILLERAEKEGMTPELDQFMNNYLSKVDNTLKECMSKRKPTTAIFDSITSMFTSLEARLDRKKPTSISAKIQIKRDQYALKLRQEQEERDRQTRIKQEKENEKINIHASIQKALNEWFVNSMTSFLGSMMTTFNEATEEDFEKKLSEIDALPNELPLKKFNEWNCPVSLKHINQTELNEIIQQVKEEMKPKFISIFSEQVKEKKQEIKDKVPGKRLYFKEMKEANKKERERLQAEQKAKAEKEEADLKEKAEQEKNKAVEQIELTAQSETANVAFNAISESAQGNTIAKGREGVEITLLAPQAAVLIFQTWFENEGKNLTVDEILKKKIDSMVKFCEKHTIKTGEIIDAPKLIAYKDIFKTKINR